MNLGDGIECLRNPCHAPFSNKRGIENGVEAYAGGSEDYFWCAASTVLSSAMILRIFPCTIALRWDPSYVPDFVALHRAS